MGFIPFKVNGCSLSHLLTFKIDKMQFAVLFLVVSAVWLCRFHSYANIPAYSHAFQSADHDLL